MGGYRRRYPKTCTTEGKLEEDWSVASHKTIKPGDRAFVVRVGVEPKGIFASGIISSEPFLASRKGRIYHRINIAIDSPPQPRKTAHPHPRHSQNRQPRRPNLDTTSIRYLYKAGNC